MTRERLYGSELKIAQLRTLRREMISAIARRGYHHPDEVESIDALTEEIGELHKRSLIERTIRAVQVSRELWS